MDSKTMRQGGRAAFDKLGATVRNLNGPVGAMSGGQRQGIAVARAAAWAQKVVFLDEPTAALGVVQTDNVLDLVRRVADDGLGVGVHQPLDAARHAGRRPSPGDVARPPGGDRTARRTPRWNSSSPP
jgi:ABC-type lipoprotein export system ATPase subunit